MSGKCKTTFNQSVLTNNEEWYTRIDLEADEDSLIL